MATAHLIHGFLGAGKTTLAKRLESALPAIRFTHDEWMSGLYGDDPPLELFSTYYQRVLDRIDLVWPRCLELGVDVVLDLNLWTRAHRDRTRSRAAAAGAEIKLYEIACSDEAAWARIEQRNRHLEGNLFISRATFDLLKTRFEPIEPDEEVWARQA